MSDVLMLEVLVLPVPVEHRHSGKSEVAYPCYLVVDEI